MIPFRDRCCHGSGITNDIACIKRFANFYIRAPGSSMSKALELAHPKSKNIAKTIDAGHPVASAAPPSSAFSILIPSLK